MQFDEKARELLRMMYVPDDFSKVNLHEVDVVPLTCREARGYIATFHYSRTMPDSSRFIYGAVYKGRVVGVCVFGMGCGKNQYTSVYKDIQNGEYIELTRLWMEDSMPKNSESYFISRCLKKLPHQIKMVISFSDAKQNHVGYIYQATNWAYLGVNKGGRMMANAEGYEAHPRLLGIYRMRHPEYRNKNNNELMNILGFRYITGGRKHKYIYIRDKKLRRHIQLKTLPYPKGDIGYTRSLLDFKKGEEQYDLSLDMYYRISYAHSLS